MSLALHLFVRGNSSPHFPSADDVQRSNALDQALEHRVIELSLRGFVLTPSDLGGDPRDLPELLALLHEAAQVHLYGVDVHVALRVLPYLRPDALEQTPIYVHGPCIQSPVLALNSSILRLSEWPGPVHYDAAALLSLELEGETSDSRFPLDPFDASLEPCAGERGPIEGLADDAAVVVCLSPKIPAAIIAKMQATLDPVFSAYPAPIDVAWIEEASIDPRQARGYRRLAQLCIAWGWGDPIIGPALLCKTPLWVMNAQATASLAEFWRREYAMPTQDHELAQVQEPEFVAKWQASMDTWAKGQGLATCDKLRQTLMQHCVAQAA